MDERPLSALRPGDRGTIGRLDGSGPIRQRLLELGLTPGTVVTLVRLAPLQDPMEIQVRGYQLCVRRSEAESVWIREALHGEPFGTHPGGTPAVKQRSKKASTFLWSWLSAITTSPALRVAALALLPFRTFLGR